MKKLNTQNSFLQSELERIIKIYIDSALLSLRFMAGGSNGKVFRAELADGRAVAIKAYREQGNNLREAAQLKILSANTCVPMPEVIFTHTDENTSVLGMSFIEGRNVLNPAFLLKSKGQKETFCSEVISGMSMWHEVKNGNFGALDNPQYTTWHEYYINEKQQPWLNGLDTLAKNGKFSKRKLDLLYRATDVFDHVYDEPEKAVLIHGDLNIMNIMADLRTFELKGFIDPMGSIWADREYDLFQLLNMWGNSFNLYETYKQKHSLTKGSDFRIAYYGAMNEAACRLGSGHIFGLWEDLCMMRLEKMMKNY